MKPTSRILPHTLVVCAAPFLASFSANAHVVTTNESNGTGAWTLVPAASNLLNGVTPSPATVVSHEGSSTDWNTVIDGTLGDVGGSASTSCTPNNGNSVTFPLNLTSHPAGRNITSFDSYCTWANSGRDNQDYTLQYSTVANPTTFINIHTVRVQTTGDRSTHTRLTDTSGFLATGVHSIRIIFNRQENSWVGYREFVLQDAPVVACVSNEKNNDNVWILPPGPNLLTAPTTTPATHESSSATWATTIDGSVGDHTSPASSVTPNNGTSVVFPLDLTGHPTGRNLVSFDSYAAWGSDGRDDQHYTLEYSTVAAPTTFLPITAVAAHSEFVNGPRRATHSRITSNTGTLATGVHSLRLTFNGQENGYEGYREFIARDTPLPVVVKHESKGTDTWTLPVGTNLLSNGLAKTPPTAANANHGNGDITNADWTTLTDGSTGAAGVQLTSVAPLDGTSVVFPLDVSANINGYNITSFDSYCSWGDSGRDDQNYLLSYSTVANPATFIPITRVENHTIDPTNSTHTRLTAASGFLATGVAAVKVDFQNQENGYTGFREFIALGSAVPLAGSLTWSGLGDANWIAGPDNNWKDSSSGLQANFTSVSPLTFDDTGLNRDINLPAALTAADLTFINDASHPYTFGGAALTVSNGVVLSGAGTAAFGNSLQASGVTVSGTGGLTLSGSNTLLTGTAAVSAGTLTLASDDALGTAALALSGGTTRFTSATPGVTSISGTAGAITLGNPDTSADTDLQINGAISTTYLGSIADASATANGRLTKNGAGTLTLGGTNSYTGPTTVTEGTLRLNKRLSLYNGNTAAWTASNVMVQGFSKLGLSVGGAGEFTGTDLAALDTGGFDPDTLLSLDTSSGDYEISTNLGGSINILKEGLNTLTLSGSNTFTGSIAVAQGALAAANPSGTSISGDLEVGNITFDAWVNMLADDQFGADSLVRFNTGPGAVNGKLQLRGTQQTVAGLESSTSNRLAVIQNDETTAPGYNGNPGPATLTINTAADTEHSFHGIIRNKDGGSVSLVKTGPGTQEIVSPTVIESHSYNGPTTISEGTLRLRFTAPHRGFSSNVTIEEGAIFNLHSIGSGYDFDRIVSGDGSVLVTGSVPVALTNGLNSWTGGTLVDGGFFALKTVNGNDIGQGDSPGQTCVGGAMDPSNVINVINGGTLSLDAAAPLGNSPVLPEFAPSVRINEGCKLYGGTNTVAFVSNITLDGGEIDLTSGAITGDFNTNLCFVGTLVVGGDSTLPAMISTSGTGPNANASLGSAGLPGTVFQVADVTGDAAADLTVSSVLRNVGSAVSPLTKTGPGTMLLTGANLYTGDTTVSGGELVVTGNSIADAGKLVLDGGKLGIEADESVSALFFGSAEQVPGTYGSTASAATFKDNTRFSGTGVLTVTGPGLTYESWALVIPDQDKRDRTDDADEDGFSNLEEFLFGTSPINATGSLAQIESTGSELIVRWNQLEAGSSVYMLQENTDLEDPWLESTATISDNLVQDLPDYIRKEAVIPVDDVRKFVRVEATE